MKTVTKLFVASLCMGLSGVVYAQPAAMAPTKPVASATDTAKPKAAKHKLSAPTEASATPVSPAASDAKPKHAVSAPSDAAATKVKPAAPATKDAKHVGNTLSPVGKSAPSVEAPKAAK